MTGALVWLCALIAIAASVSLWWLLAAAGAFLAWMHSQRQQGTPPLRRLSTATLVSLVSYALLLSIALLTVRAALGLLELPVVPFEPAGFAPGMQRASLGYYDKSEMYRALLQLAALTVLFAIVFVRLAGHWMRQRGEPLVMHPLSAAFAFVLYFASVRLPPYPVDLDYWYPLVAAAAHVRSGEWLSFLVDPNRDPLRPYLLGLWLGSFGLSALSLSAAAAICNIAAGLASFALVHRLTGSRAVALLGASYLLLEATTTHANRLTFPAPAHAALAMLLLYLSLRSRGERTWPAFFFGLILAWDPLFGVFAAIGFLLAHSVRPASVRTALALCAGTGTSIVATLVVHGALALSSPQSDAAPAVEKILASPPQEAALGSLLPFLVFLVPVFVLLALATRRRERLQQWSARSLFAGATLLCAIPYAHLAAARADPSSAYSIQWVLLPAAALALYGAVRAILLKERLRAPRHFRAALSLGTTAILLVLCFDLFFPIDRLNLILARYATAYESERANWYRRCAEGLACDPGAKPTLAHYVRHASRPLILDRETTRGL